jgi:hypothetical protein
VVKCSDCGYLAVRHLETRELWEAEGGCRETGEIPPDLNRPKNLYDEVPLCFERLRFFDPEQCASPAGRKEAQQMEIGPCVGFVKWQHGFTPKEHREMLDRKELLKWQAKREDDDRQWRADQARGERTWRWIQVLVFGVMGAAVAIVAAVIQR